MGTVLAVAILATLTVVVVHSAYLGVRKRVRRARRAYRRFRNLISGIRKG